MHSSDVSNLSYCSQRRRKFSNTTRPNTLWHKYLVTDAAEKRLSGPWVVVVLAAKVSVHLCFALHSRQSPALLRVLSS
jgi:hypothetical protein